VEGVSAPSSIVVVNAGSSSVKMARFDRERGEHWGERWRQQVDEVHDVGAVVADALAALLNDGQTSPAAVGHRIVHGGPRHGAPAVADAALIDELAALAPLAPLHQPPGVAGLRAAVEAAPEAAQVVCFDTAFHRTIGPDAATLPFASTRREAGALRRYGFHGLAYESVVAQLGADRLGRAVLAHLGSGSSACAVVGGRSVDTTMGLTPTGGMVMATRSGDLDPGVLIHLLRTGGDDGGGLDAVGLEQLVNHASGYDALGGSPDMRQLLDRRERDDADAALAIGVFCHSVRRHIAGLAASAGGLDTLVFSGGIGEHAPVIRAEVAGGLAFLGVELDAHANNRSAGVISALESPVAVHVVAVDEERVIAEHTAALLDL
jgi:acetate kinase